METTDTLDGLLYKVNLMFSDLNNTISTITNENSKLTNIIDDLNKKINAANFKYDNDIEIITNKLIAKQEEFDNLRKVSYITSINKQLSDKNNYIKILESQLEKLKKPTKYIEKIDLNSQLISETICDTQLHIEQTDANLDLISETISDTQSEKEQNKEIITHSDKEQNKEIITQSDKEQNKEIITQSDKEQNKEIITQSEKKQNKKSKESIHFDYQFDPNMFEDINGFELLVYKKKYYLRDLETSEIYDIFNNKQNKIVGLFNSKGKIKLKK
jgi:hypothetical protein